MKVNVPALAPPVPPETGASSAKIPRAAASCATARALSTSTVEQSNKMLPSCIAGRIWSATARRIAPLGSIVITRSARMIASAAEVALVIPSTMMPAVSKPVTQWPALIKLAAIGAPMLPRPINPICILASSNVNFARPSGINMRETATAGTASRVCCHCGLRTLSMMAARIPSRKSPCSIAR